MAFAVAVDWRACTHGTTFNYGNLPRGVNPLFMFSVALPQMLGYSAGFQIYVEDIVIPASLASGCGLVDKIVADRPGAKHVTLENQQCAKYARFMHTALA